MEALPDLASLSDDELRQVIDDLTKEETDISFRRRVLQGRIDILLSGQTETEGVDTETLRERLAKVLTGKVERPDVDDLPEDVRREIDELRREEHDLSYRRRMLHGRIDILRAELVARLQRTHSSGTSLHEDDVRRLTDLLSDKAPPPVDADGEADDGLDDRGRA